MDEIKHYQEDEKDEISYKVTLGGLEELALTNTLEEVFPETIKALMMLTKCLIHLRIS